MKQHKWLRRLLFPSPILLAVLLPLAGALLIGSMCRLPETHPVRLGAYVLSFYTLTIWCLRIPAIVRWCRRIKTENRYLRRWFADPRLRMNVTVTGNLLWNGAYAALQLGLGMTHHSPWFYSLAGYYTCLALMRLVLVHHTLRHTPGADLHRELVAYRICGWIFLILNLALSGMMVSMLLENRDTRHQEIITIAMAAYTFTTLTMAIVNLIRYRRYHSPAMSASKAISLAAACVSLLTLENTMLQTFRQDTITPETIRLFLTLSGAGVSLLMILMAVYMIVQSYKNQTIGSDDHARK